MNPKAVRFYNKRLKRAAFGCCPEAKYTYLCRQHEERYSKRRGERTASLLGILSRLDMEELEALPDFTENELGGRVTVTPEQIIEKCHQTGAVVPKWIRKVYYW